MPPNRYYSSQAIETTLTSPISAAATTMVVAATTGYPTSTPFTVTLEQGTSNEEIVDVTNVAGTTWTITRGVDGSSGLAHSAGAKVVHAFTARDAREPQVHMATDVGVHGLDGADHVVGEAKAQTLTNKTLTTPTINTPTMSGGGSWAGSPTINTPTLAAPVIADLSSAQHDHSAANKGGNIPQGSVTGLSARLTSIEGVNTAQDSTLSSYGTRLTNVETTNTSQGNTLTSYGSRLTAIENSWQGNYQFHDFIPDRTINSDTMSELVDLRQTINFSGTFPPGSSHMMTYIQAVISSPASSDPRFGLKVDGDEMGFFNVRPVGTGSGHGSEVVYLATNCPLSKLTAGNHTFSWWACKGAPGDPNFLVMSAQTWMHVI